MNEFNEIEHAANKITDDIVRFGFKAAEYLVRYFKFIGKQITHLRRWAYALIYLAIGFQGCLLVVNPITPVSVVTFFGTVLGLACVVCISNARSINGLLGLVSAACFIFTAFKAKNFLTIGEQLSYVVTLDLPVLISPTWNKGMVDNIKTLHVKGWITAIASTIIIATVSAFAVSTIDPRPVPDAITFAISFVAGVLCFLGYNNNFIWWLAVGIFQVILWGQTAMQGDASIAMLISSLMYLSNDGFALTLSPWFNKRVRHETSQQNKRVFN